MTEQQHRFQEFIEQRKIYRSMMDLNNESIKKVKVRQRTKLNEIREKNKRDIDVYIENSNKIFNHFINELGKIL